MDEYPNISQPKQFFPACWVLPLDTFLFTSTMLWILLFYRCINLALIVISFLLTIIIFLLSFLVFLALTLIKSTLGLLSVFVFIFQNCLGEILCKYSKQQNTMYVKYGQSMNLKEMALHWIKQNEVNYEHIPEEQVSKPQKWQVSPSYLCHKWDYEIFFPYYKHLLIAQKINIERPATW